MALLKPFSAGLTFRQRVHESRTSGTVMTYMLDAFFLWVCMCVSIRFATLINFNDLMTCTHMVITQHLYWPLQTVMAFNGVMRRKMLCVFQRPVMCSDDGFYCNICTRSLKNLHSGKNSE